MSLNYQSRRIIALALQNTFDGVSATLFDDLVVDDINHYVSTLMHDLYDWSELTMTYHQRVIFTTSGTFIKSDYPWLQYVIVHVVGAGGGGGGVAATGATQSAVSTGGSGGCYARSLFSDVASIPSSVTVTVGAGGAGGLAGANPGSNGGESSFGSGTGVEVSGAGGAGGLAGVTVSSAYSRVGVPGANTGVGQIVIPGGDSQPSISPVYLYPAPGKSGESYFSFGIVFTGGYSGNGPDAASYGGGGGAAVNANRQAARPGGAGGDGLVILDLWG